MRTLFIEKQMHTIIFFECLFHRYAYHQLLEELQENIYQLKIKIWIMDPKYTSMVFLYNY